MDATELKKVCSLKKDLTRAGCWDIHPVVKVRALRTAPCPLSSDPFVEKGKIYSADEYDEDGKYPNTLHLEIGFWWPLDMFELVKNG